MTFISRNIQINGFINLVYAKITPVALDDPVDTLCHCNKSFVVSIKMTTQCFPTDLGTFTCIIDSKEKHSVFVFVLNI